MELQTWSLVLYLDRGETDKFCHTEKFQRYNFQNINMVLISIILCNLKVFDFVSIKIHDFRNFCQNGETRFTWRLKIYKYSLGIWHVGIVC